MTLHTRHLEHLGQIGPRLPPHLNLGARKWIKYSQLQDLTPSWEATLRRILSPALHTPLLLRQQLDTAQSSPRVGFTTRGPLGEVSIAGNGGDFKQGELEGLTLKELGRSDSIILEYARGRHLPNRRFTSLSSGVRSGRIPEGNTTTTTSKT